MRRVCEYHLYRFNVSVRVIDLVGGGTNMPAVVKRGQLKASRGLGFYLIANEIPAPKVDVISALPVEIQGSVVVRASGVRDALYQFHRHPGVVGTGKEDPDKKAVWLPEGARVIEFPDCDCQGAYDGGCLSVSKVSGWAFCRYVQETPCNQDYGYCHCFLQRADEPPSGCLVEAYCERLSVGARRDRSSVIDLVPLDIALSLDIRSGSEEE